VVDAVSNSIAGEVLDVLMLGSSGATATELLWPLGPLGLLKKPNSCSDPSTTITTLAAMSRKRA